MVIHKPSRHGAIRAVGRDIFRNDGTHNNSPNNTSASTQQQQPHQPAIRSLHVIYDADGSITGELVYMAKKLLGLAHCAACEITHGPRAENPEFTALKRGRWRVPGAQRG